MNTVSDKVTGMLKSRHVSRPNIDGFDLGLEASSVGLGLGLEGSGLGLDVSGLGLKMHRDQIDIVAGNASMFYLSKREFSLVR